MSNMELKTERTLLVKILKKYILYPSHIEEWLKTRFRVCPQCSKLQEIKDRDVCFKCKTVLMSWLLYDGKWVNKEIIRILSAK